MKYRNGARADELSRDAAAFYLIKRTVINRAAMPVQFAAAVSVFVIGIGAGLAARPLPHHRAYGSVHGGSDRLPGYMNPTDGSPGDWK